MKLEDLKKMIADGEMTSMVYCWSHDKAIMITKEKTYHITMTSKQFSELQDLGLPTDLKTEIDNKKKPEIPFTKKTINWDESEFEKLYQEGLNYSEITERIGCSIASVVRKVAESVVSGEIKKRKLGLLKSEKDKAKFLEMLENGMKAEAIAKEFGCSVSTVRRNYKNYFLRKCGS
jgi:transposase